MPSNTITTGPTTQNLLAFLKPREADWGTELAKYKFNARLVATPAAVAAHGIERILVCSACLQSQVALLGGLDYIQVFTFPGERLWFMDDGTHVTALLPSDY